MAKDISKIINPASIAVVGATNRKGSVGLAVFSNLIYGGYQGVLFPINPKARSIQGVKAYPRLVDVPDPVDLVVIVVPPEAAIDTLNQAGQIGARGAVVITAGFKEVGGAGVELERRLKEAANRANIPLVGPNCLGVINTDHDVSMNASFATKMPRPGNIAFISQSGALCTAVLDVAAGRNIGFSKFISFGNKADVTEIDLLRYLRDDPETEVILMYLEDISNGREFIEVAREIAWDAKKPMLAIKSGTSPEGAKAASSHTGSLAGSEAAYDAIFMQSGIQRVEGITELFHYAQAFGSQPVPKGNRIAIVTNAGGPGIMATDAAVRHGLKLAKFSEATLAKLKNDLPPTASIHNPVDVIGDATHERYEAAIRHVLQDENVDGAVIILTPQAMTDILETAHIVPTVVRGIDKPVLCSFMGIVDVSAGVNHLQQNGIPNYMFPEAAVRTLAAMARFGDKLKPQARWVKPVQADCSSAQMLINESLELEPVHLMHEHEANRILQCYGFPLLRSRLVTKPEELEAAAAFVGFPLVMKIVSPQIVHKSDAGGVKVGIKDLAEARVAFQQILDNARAYNPEAVIEGVYLAEMAKKGVEVILGAHRDPKMGPIVMFGLGGTLVEVLKDVSFRLAPMWESSAERMIQEIKAYKVLQGVRGNPPSDIEAIKDCILRLSQLLDENPQIAEMDINPLIVYPKGQGCAVADCRIILQHQ
ncbi:MAG: acetate--CoA ligase family protein [Desulfarculus sp.]|nr:acetate--CoA ligase family protein [Desulfarculus sp.]